ncbi:hypothetical protein ACFY1L_09805 [Streptomyces sp. NPDC001663]|uniref:hypothetical protein n=1 Tax=Streptomyces sp. NPDC001663 TaxID=3364597 RepID=UPI0036C34086
MSSETVVRAAWWSRAEPVAQLAERWLELLTRLSELSEGALAEWRWDEDARNPGQQVPARSEDFARALEAANTHDDLDILGYKANVTVTQPDGGYAHCRVQAGGTNGYSPFTAVLQLFPGPDATAAPLTGRSAEALAILAGVWDADYGLTYDRALFKQVKTAFGLTAAHPRCGWSVHLSAHRAARVPTDFPARRLPADHGGLVLDLADTPGGTPATETVLAAHKALTDSGSLEPLPVPATRPKL